MPLRETRGEKSQGGRPAAGQASARGPFVAWLATEPAAGITSQIFHTGRGGIAIMQLPAVIKQFHKSSGVWSFHELDQNLPQLMAAKQAADQSVKDYASGGAERG